MAKKGSRLAAESHTAAINLIEEIIHQEKILYDFSRLDGSLFSSSNMTRLEPSGVPCQSFSKRILI